MPTHDDTEPVIRAVIAAPAPACGRCLGPLDADFFCSICGAVTLPPPAAPATRAHGHAALIRRRRSTHLTPAPSLSTFDAPTRAQRLAGREV